MHERKGHNMKDFKHGDIVEVIPFIEKYQNRFNFEDVMKWLQYENDMLVIWCNKDKENVTAFTYHEKMIDFPKILLKHYKTS